MQRRTAIKLAAAAGAGTILMPNQLFSNPQGASFSKSDFGEDFLWGVATSSYQIEGAANEDGRGPSIWDTFCREKGKVLNGETGDVACDFYHRYATDLELVKEMNMKAFRFSLAWSRILPEGRGKINQKGLDFYHRVIDRCVELGIEPWITIFHWDLPQALQDEGGWTNRKTVDAFAEYTNVVTKEFGEKVKNWMVLNEPMAFVAVGHMLGMHAPGDKSLKKFIAATHHATLCQAEGGRIVRANVSNANVGTTFSCSHIAMKDDDPKHEGARQRLDALVNRLFIEPALGLGYPIDDGWKTIGKVEKHFEPGDEEKMKFDFDFIGIQNYTRIIARKAFWPPVLWANQVKPENIPGAELTEMKWEVYPEGIYKILKQFSAYKEVDKIMVTENGCAMPDKLENGRVHDARRRKFYQDYLANVLRAKKEGVNLQGYFAWTLMDNFEWAEGYHPRFGLVHVDFETQQRTIKDSGLWFKEFLK